MTKEIKAYIQTVTAFIALKPVQADKKAFAANMLIRIRFYQHERFIHLIVTALFALLAIISFAAASADSGMLILSGLFLLLLIPYIAHYYFLENSVQKLYKLYYELTEVPHNG